MDLFTILEFAQSSDQESRNMAEHELHRLERCDLNKLCLNLSVILAQKGINLEIRRLAGLILKNKIDYYIAHIDEHKAAQLSDISNCYLKSDIIENTMKALQDDEKFVRRTASQVLAKIILKELNSNQKIDLIAQFLYRLQTSQLNVNMYQAILEIIQFIFQEINFPLIIQANQDFLADNILKSLFSIMNPQCIVSDDLKISAFETFLSCLPLFDKKIHIKEIRDYIFKCICNQLTDQNSQIRKLGFDILDRLSQPYYEYFNDYIVFIFEFTIKILQENDESVTIRAIEFWSSIAEKEFEINLMSLQSLHEGRISPIFSRYYTLKASHMLPKCLLNCISNRNENGDSEEWNCSNSAGICINLMSQAAPRELITLVNGFVESNLINSTTTTSSIEAAFLAFVAIFDGIGSKLLYGKIHSLLLLFIPYLLKSNNRVSNLTAWMIIKISSIGSFFIRENAYIIMQSIFLKLHDEKCLGNIPWSIGELAATFNKEGYFSWCFEEISEFIVILITSKEKQKTKTNKYFEILASLILNSSIREKGRIFSIFSLIFYRLKEKVDEGCVKTTPEVQDFQNQLIRIVNIIFQKYGKKINNFFSEHLVQFIEILISYVENDKADNILDEEIIIFIGTCVHTLEVKSRQYLNKWIPFLLNRISIEANAQLASLALGTLGDICRAFGTKFAPYLEKTLNVLINVLQNEKVTRSIKPLILSCLGDIAFTTEDSSSAYFIFTTPFFKATSIFVQNLYETGDPDKFECKLQLNESILEGMSSLIQNTIIKTDTIKIFQKLDWILDFIRQLFKEDKTIRISHLCIGLVGDLSLNFLNFKNVFSKEKWVQQILYEYQKSVEEKNRNLCKWVKESFK